MIPEVAATVTAGVPNGGAEHGARSGHAKDSTLIPTTAQCLNAGAMGRQDAESETLIAFNHQTGGDFRPMCQHDQANALQANQGQAVAFDGDISRPLMARHDSSPCPDRGMDVVSHNMSVRRLTPRECERLQGFPDDYTAIPYRGKTALDGPRYKALGNSMAVPVVRWIGERIAAVSKTFGGVHGD